MALIEWTDALSVGYAEIDEDHQHLVGLLNRLDEAVTAGKADTVVGELLDELVSYTVWHFRHEERLMQTYADPTFFDHQQEHEALAQQVVERQRAFSEGTGDVANDLLPFLKSWLTKHILGTDAKTGKYIAECVTGIRASA